MELQKLAVYEIGELYQKKHHLSQVWWLTAINLALVRLRQQSTASSR